MTNKLVKNQLGGLMPGEGKKQDDANTARKASTERQGNFSDYSGGNYGGGYRHNQRTSRFSSPEFFDDPIADIGGRNHSSIGGSARRQDSFLDDRGDIPDFMRREGTRPSTSSSHIPMRVRQDMGREAWEIVNVVLSDDQKTAYIPEADMAVVGKAVVRGIADVLDGTNLVMTTAAVGILKDWQTKVMEEMVKTGGLLYKDVYQGYVKIEVGEAPSSAAAVAAKEAGAQSTLEQQVDLLADEVRRKPKTRVDECIDNIYAGDSYDAMMALYKSAAKTFGYGVGNVEDFVERNQLVARMKKCAEPDFE